MTRVLEGSYRTQILKNVGGLLPPPLPQGIARRGKAGIVQPSYYLHAHETHGVEVHCPNWLMTAKKREEERLHWITTDWNEMANYKEESSIGDVSDEPWR